MAGCGIAPETSFDDDTTMSGIDIGDLREMYGSPLTIADDIIIAGRVVSSDRAGNFYNTFFIDDGTGAVEIMAGMPDLDASYRPGQRVVVRARGLAAGWSNGVLQLGLSPEPGSGFQTGYFYHPVVIRRYVSRGRDVEEVTPEAMDIPQLTEAMCGRLVRIDGLVLDEGENAGSWEPASDHTSMGYRRFTDPDGNVVSVVVSKYARFAYDPVPTNRVSVTGILLYGKGGAAKDHFLLKLRNEKDIAY